VSGVRIPPAAPTSLFGPPMISGWYCAVMPHRRRRVSRTLRGVAASACVLGSVAVADSAAVATEAPSHVAHVAGTILPGTNCPVFPVDNVWNTSIAQLPVNVNSARWMAATNSSSTYLHPDFGPSGDPRQPYGIPWNVVPAHVTFTRITFQYASESDRGPYPLTLSTPIEGGSDRHALMVDPHASATSSACTLFETYDTYFHSGGKSTAGSGAIWMLTSNALRPATFTSADAAGLPILSGLVNYNEVMSGAMDHAIRFTAQCTNQAYLWPARHQAGQAAPQCPPMGARFRLRASYTLPRSQCSAFCQTVLTTMKTYGLILADNGSNWYFQGTADTRWTYTQVDQLKAIRASAFVAVNESCLEISASSAQARQPGTATYASRCRS
jgi:hypothetical protein